MTVRARGLLTAAVLLVGALFYFVRPTDPVAVSWLEHAGLPSLAHALHDARAFAWAHAPFPGWLRGSISDFAYGLALGIVFAGSNRTLMIIGFSAALAHEVGQGLGWFAGTFDVIDIVVLVLGYVVGAVGVGPAVERVRRTRYRRA